MIGRPLVGQHLIETRIVVVQAQQQFTQVGPRFDPVTLGAGEDREQDGRARPGLLAAQEQPVFSPDRLVTERSFADVVVDRQPTVLGVATECSPLIAGVPDRLAQRALGQRPFLQLRQVRLDPIEHRFCFGRTDLTPRVGRQLAGPLLDVVQLPDPLQDLVRIPRRTVPRIEELAARMRPTGNFADRVVRPQIDVVVAAVGVGMEVTLESCAGTWPVRRGRDSP